MASFKKCYSLCIWSMICVLVPKRVLHEQDSVAYLQFTSFIQNQAKVSVHSCESFFQDLSVFLSSLIKIDLSFTPEGPPEDTA